MKPEICSIKNDPYHPPAGHVTFLPLGGSGEIGMNVNLYGVNGQWLLVDLGIIFGDNRFPSIDVMMPDLTFISERRDRLKGLVITHAHEDHLGAIPYVWPYLECPIYATPFTAQIIRNKLEETSFKDQVQIIEIPLQGAFSVGDFSVRYVTMTHSIPEPNGLVIEAAGQRLFHSGDWKLDGDPRVGDTVSSQVLSALGDQGVDAFIGDSTNSTQPGRAGSEGDVAEELAALLETYTEQRVLVTCFASNVARVKSIAQAAEKVGRTVVLSGRSLWKMTEAARQCGYLENIAPFQTEDALQHLPRANQLIICTGSQGEPRAGLARVAKQEHPRVSLSRGDVVIFSSKKIPGNEQSVQYVQNKLIEQGIELVTDKHKFVHVSGHPCRDELYEMYQWVRPKLSIPVHGEIMHMTAHAELAKECGVAQTIVPHNGGIYTIGADGGKHIGDIDVGLWGMDAGQLIDLDSLYMRQKKKSLFEGTLVVSAVIDGEGRLLDDVLVSMIGIADLDTDFGLNLVEAIQDKVAQALENISPKHAHDEAWIKEQIRVHARREVRYALRKRPVTEVHLLRGA